MIGPLVVTEIYELWGTYVLFSVVTATLLVSLVLTIVSWRYLVPVMANNSNDDISRPGVEGGKQKVVSEEPGRRVPGSHLPTFAVFEEEEEEKTE